MAVFTLNDAVSRALRNVAMPPSPPRARLASSGPTGRRMRRGSVKAGAFEATFFTVPAKGETDHLLRVARRTLDAGRRLRRDARAGTRVLSAAERAIAALTGAAVRVYEELLTLARLNRGRVFPTYDHLARATGLGRATVARALPILERIGFLVRQRRFKRIETPGTMPRYAQTSNMYRALLPARVLAYLPRWMRPAPLPDDAASHRMRQTSDHRSMLATLSCRELAHATLDGPLGSMLARLGAAIDRKTCESQIDPQSSTKILR